MHLRDRVSTMQAYEYSTFTPFGAIVNLTRIETAGHSVERSDIGMAHWPVPLTTVALNEQAQ